MSLYLVLDYCLLLVLPLLTEWGYFVRGRNWKEYFGPRMPDGHTKNSLFWGVIVGLPTFTHLVLGYNIPMTEAALLSAEVALMAFATNAWIGHGAHQSCYVWYDQKPGDGEWTEKVTFWLPWFIKRTKATLPLYNWIGLTVIGVIRCALIATPLALQLDPVWWGLAFAGFFHPAAYWRGWRITHEATLRPALPACESCWGLTFGVGYAWTALAALLIV